MREAVEGGLASLVDRALGLLDAVRDFVLSIPLIGYLLDQLERIIKAAVEFLGIQSALEAIGAQIRALPFFQRLEAFANRLEDAVNEVEERVQSLEALLERAETEVRDFERRAKEVIERFVGVKIDKDVIEALLPGWLRDARERLIELRERLRQVADEEERGEERERGLRRGYDDSRRAVEKVLAGARLGPQSGFAAAAYERLEPPLARLSQFAAAIESAPGDPGPVETALEEVAAMETTLAPFREAAAALPPGYFESLRALLRETPQGRAHLEAVRAVG